MNLCEIFWLSREKSCVLWAFKVYPLSPVDTGRNFRSEKNALVLTDESPVLVQSTVASLFYLTLPKILCFGAVSLLKHKMKLNSVPQASHSAGNP